MASNLTATLNVPLLFQNQMPPTLDAYWLPAGSTPLGSSPLGATISGVDTALVALLLAQGFTISTWSA
jgi:hypothetical protein